MANLLRDRGHTVRIACPKVRPFSIDGLKRLVRQRLIRSNRNAGFLHQFRGPIEAYGKLDDLTFAPGEIVIAVGTYMVADVRGMTKPVIKARFNHGFAAKPDAIQAKAWDGPMPTITVSRTLLPQLRKICGDAAWGVVPNGVDTTAYYAEPGASRTGIGALYNPHPNKAPEDLIAVLQTLHAKHPDVPQHVFSTEPAPPELGHVAYTRYPPVDEARALYNRCKIWLVTSLTEGLPGVVLEAMACGCTIVTSDNDGSLEIIRDGVNGLVTPRGDREGFVRQVERLLADDLLRRQLAAAGDQTIREFTWDRAADRMEEFLRAVPGL
ncbi:MAG: glycosyltransferase family 4 protein [Opitutaceae bacterium]|nr:glycosyltransferase family 4 protein [Opitutaceae bacterium]